MFIMNIPLPKLTHDGTWNARLALLDGYISKEHSDNLVRLARIRRKKRKVNVRQAQIHP